MKNIGHTANPYTQAWSFTRYSTKGQNKQHGGSSEARQDANFTRVCKEYGWTEYEYKILLDGVSGYRKDKDGKPVNFAWLRKIVADVKSGVIKKNIPMVCERTDRFGRGDMDEAYQMLREIVINGCPVWIEGILLDKEALNDDEKTGTVRRRMVQANEYSKNLGNSVSEALRIRTELLLEGKRFMEDGEGKTIRILLNHLPNWIDKDKWTVNSKGEIIKQIFSDYLNNIGPAAIARKLNSAKVETLSGKGSWSQSFVYRLLSDRRLIGEVEVVVDKDTEEVKKIGDYFPVVIDEKTFSDAVVKLNANCHKRPVGLQPSGKVANLFGGVLFCTCGYKVALGHGKGGDCFSCYGRKNIGVEFCNHPMMKYSTVEAAILHIIRLNPSALLADDNAVENQIQILRSRKMAVETDLEQCQNMIATAPLDQIRLLLPTLNARIENYKKQIADIDTQIIVEGSKVVNNQENIWKIAEMQANLGNIRTDNELRKIVNQWFVANCKKITINRSNETINNIPSKCFQAELTNGSLITMDLSGNIKGSKALATLFSEIKPQVPALKTKMA